MSTSNLFKVFGINQIGSTNCVDVPLRISGLITAQDEVGIPARIECEEDSIGSALMLNSQLLHVGIPRPLQGIHLGTSQCRPQSRQRLNNIVNAAAFFAS